MSDCVLFTEEEYDKIVSSASEDMTDDDVLRLVRYCEMTRIRQCRVDLILKGLFLVTGILEDGQPICEQNTPNNGL